MAFQVCLGLLLCLNLAAAASEGKSRPTISQTKPKHSATAPSAPILEAPVAQTIEQTEQARQAPVEDLERGFNLYGFNPYRPKLRYGRRGIVNLNSNSNSNSDYLSQRSSLYNQMFNSQQQIQRPNRPFFGKSAGAEEPEYDEVDLQDVEPIADADAESVDVPTEKVLFPLSRPRLATSSIINTNTNINTNTITDYASLFSSIFDQLTSTQMQQNRPNRPVRPSPYYPYFPYFSPYTFHGKSDDSAVGDDQAADTE